MMVEEIELVEVGRELVMVEGIEVVVEWMNSRLDVRVMALMEVM